MSPGGTEAGAGREGTLFPREPRVVSPGAVHVPGWLSTARQRELVEFCRARARGPVPMRQTVLPGGGVMSVRTVCVGWHWQPYRYSRTADDVNGARVADFPDWLVELGRSALTSAYGAEDAAGAAGATRGGGESSGGDGGPATYTPDTALINFYDDAARMGMHQDKEERSGAPVVSLSIGDTCLFRFGNAETRGRPYTDVELVSGDLFVFGGPARFAYHGVPKVYPGTADPATGMSSGRLNITLRETGLPG
ncbi:alpha-ketoglutarate-dependent dioxygenase AlkB family protein [Streptomyces sp. NPDC020412]|uniref:alpha-ketoglutarate-dependent dioxygenase AlkB family protein n=1 Tax=Streptomyces sp. NPDC020412 TaxID=3365073 RepID=UPI0037B3BE0E